MAGIRVSSVRSCFKEPELWNKDGTTLDVKRRLGDEGEGQQLER